MELHGFTNINRNHHLEIGGVDTTDLVKEYQTPLFVYDEELIRKQCSRFHSALENAGIDYHISYASKAFICKYLVKIMYEENMGLDVVSLGEIYNAMAAGYPVKNMHFHGNNKTDEELVFAIKNDIGCIVVDNYYEIERIHMIALDYDKKVNCLLRINPGVSAHTHEFITTGNTDSKFGINISLKESKDAIEAMLKFPTINLLGVHFHIGSQIFGTDGTKEAMNKTFSWLKELKDEYGFEAKVLNIGGGFGIRYTDEDVSYPIEKACDDIVGYLREFSGLYDLDIPQLWLEPGRSIVGEAGYTLYTVGAIKTIPDIRTYVSIDGGMSDHIRTALYGAKYEVALANKMDMPADSLVTIAGKCCESGDIIAKDVMIPEPEAGDILVVSCTGAYHYSMASNYNQMRKPAVVFVRDSVSKLAIKRESLDDLLKNQL